MNQHGIISQPIALGALLMMAVVTGCTTVTGHGSADQYPKENVKMQEQASQDEIMAQIPWGKPDSDFFRNCAFVSVDIQGDSLEKPGHVTEETFDKVLLKKGITPEDWNAGIDQAYDVAVPNARRVADACNKLGLPMIYIHWGFMFPDAMDLAPGARKGQMERWGDDPTKWITYLGHPFARPHPVYDVHENDYVIAKTDGDAFTSSNIDFVLKNLGIKNIIFVGGYTQGCLFATSGSAHEKGYKSLCIEDACNNGMGFSRLKGIADCNFNYVITVEQFEKLVDKMLAQREDK